MEHGVERASVEYQRGWQGAVGRRLSPLLGKGSWRGRWGTRPLSQPCGASNLMGETARLRPRDTKTLSHKEKTSMALGQEANGRKGGRAKED